MSEAESLFGCSTNLCADSIESPPGLSGVFALATYQVDKKEIEANISANKGTQGKDEDEDQDQEPSRGPEYTRRGTCSIRSAMPDGNQRISSNIMDQHDMPAILDMKWALANFGSGTLPAATLGVANAKGYVTLHEFDSRKLAQLSSLRLNGKNALCLSLDWSDRRGGSSHGYSESALKRTSLEQDSSLIVSQSDGSLAYLPSVRAAVQGGPTLDEALQAVKVSDRSAGEEDDSDDDDFDRTSEDERAAEQLRAHEELNVSFDDKPRGLETWKAHDFEAWIAAFDCWSQGNVVWSGGDDLKMKGWDLRTSNSGSGRQATFTVAKGFDGGVTSMQSHHLREHIWAVGSYDSVLRLFDARSPLRPVSETQAGGGIWRIKWHPTDASKLLVGCMHDGFKILSLDELQANESGSRLSRGQEMDIVTRFDKHDSLAYGCDWDRGLDEESNRLVYSCSFYDAQMHIWRS